MLKTRADCFVHSEDKRPGLAVSSQTAKEIERERKQRESNEKNKVKPKKVLENENRTEGLKTALSTDNKGFALLQKMGYKPGMVLGKKGKYISFKITQTGMCNVHLCV